MREGELSFPFAASFKLNSEIVTSWSPSHRGLSEYHVDSVKVTSGFQRRRPQAEGLPRRSTVCGRSSSL